MKAAILAGFPTVAIVMAQVWVQQDLPAIRQRAPKTCVQGSGDRDVLDLVIRNQAEAGRGATRLALL